MNNYQTQRVVHANVPVTNKRRASLVSTLFVSTFVMLANLHANTVFDDQMFVTQAELLGMTASETSYDYNAWNDLPTHFNQFDTYEHNESFMANTATMYGTPHGRSGSVAVEAGWTISVNFKLNPGASTSGRHTLLGSYFYNSTAANPLFAPHIFYIEHQPDENIFQVKSGARGYGDSVLGEVTPGQLVNFTIVRNAGNGEIQSFFNGVAGSAGAVGMLGKAGLIARETTNANDYFGLNYVLPSLGSATTDFVNAASVDVEGTTLYELPFSDKMMLGIELNRDNETQLSYFDGEITSVASYNRSLSSGQVADLYNSSLAEVPESKHFSLIVGLILLGCFFTRRRYHV